MANGDLFEGFVRVGRTYRRASRSHRALRDYTWLLEQVCSLIRHTHSLVIGKLEAIERAHSVAEARRLVDRLRADPLTHAFKVAGICDTFESHGKSLLALLDRRGTVDGLTEVVIPGSEEEWELRRFADELMGRERQVADLYSSEIRELRELIDSANGGNLEEIQDRARVARAVLTDQMVDFAALASDFATFAPQ